MKMTCQSLMIANYLNKEEAITQYLAALNEDQNPEV
jgi:DNA-binding phage protein